MLRQLDPERRLAGRLVRGHSVGQAHQFVASGAASAGFVALAQVLSARRGEVWVVPRELHRPIEQQLVLLVDTPAARRMVAFLASPPARERIAAAGYGVPP